MCYVYTAQYRKLWAYSMSTAICGRLTCVDLSCVKTNRSSWGDPSDLNPFCLVCVHRIQGWGLGKYDARGRGTWVLL